ncbi:MAG: cyclic pyranopterin monophosphate synthase MoaC [Actinomycetota bacterium]|jgi:cyclic pyranopterin phosphate synthase
MSTSGTPDEARPDAPTVRSDGLTHLDDRGRARMVDVGAKPVTARRAVASCEVRLRPDVARLVADAALPKGDALALARVAGIQAAKRTPELVPLCHQVALTSVEVDLEVDVEAGVVHVSATAAALDRTGVEMEAMTAAAVAALTLYDLVKAVQRDVVIGALRLRSKAGGRSGDLELP